MRMRSCRARRGCALCSGTNKKKAERRGNTVRELSVCIERTRARERSVRAEKEADMEGGEGGRAAACRRPCKARHCTASRREEGR